MKPVAFDYRALVSASMDSSVRVTIITEKTTNGKFLSILLVSELIIQANVLQ